MLPARTSVNTFDVRGLRVEEAIDGLGPFVDRLLSEGESAGFVLHGHGTGALKAAIRAEAGSLPYVERVRPAEDVDGGDAFTVLVLDA
jgi:DNA mismatch repair protein MutS2